MKEYLNIGCGNLFDPTWTNVDLVSRHPGVIAADVSRGLPFEDGQFKLVYHSHVLEHLLKHDAVELIKECFRVLEPGGFVRVVVPDLETMARLYLESLELALEGDESAEARYDWMMIELYDQATRTTSGGLMRDYLSRAELPAEEFVYSRLGENAKAMHRFFSRNPVKRKKRTQGTRPSLRQRMRSFLGRRRRTSAEALQDDPFYRLGRFRMSGEVHQWMYDRYSLRRLLLETGFSDFRVRTAFESYIPDWSRYHLDHQDGKVIKPESIFVEARRPG